MLSHLTIVQRYLRSNLKNTHVCNYRRDSPCFAALRDAVEANELVHLGAFPIHQMMMTACSQYHGMNGNGLNLNRQSANFGNCVVSVSKIISKNSRLDYYSGKKYNKKIIKIKLPARLLVRPWPEQPDRLLRPCNIIMISITSYFGALKNEHM